MHSLRLMLKRQYMAELPKVLFLDYSTAASFVPSHMRCGVVLAY